MAKTMYTTLLELPLFQGLGIDDITRIVEGMELDFNVVNEGRRLIAEDSPCTGLTFLLSGQLRVSTASADRSWHVEELLDAPSVVGLDVLYGSRRTHRHSYVAHQRSRVMFVAKHGVGALIARFDVFRINVLNALTTQVERTRQPLWLPPDSSTEGRIIRFFLTHVQRPAGPKRFCISQARLGEYLGEDKRYVSAALHRLEQQGLLTNERRLISIEAFERLLRDYRQK